MKLYTRTGDEGKTSLIGGRVDKDDPRVEAYGTVDEINCFVGQAISELDQKLFKDVLYDLVKIQHELFDCGADLANVSQKHSPLLQEEAVNYLEKRIDMYLKEAPKLEKFILPGGSIPASSIHIARAVTRRAERLVVKLFKKDPFVSPVCLKYLNRLSDFFFSIALVINYRLKVPEVYYDRSGNIFKYENSDSDADS